MFSEKNGLNIENPTAAEMDTYIKRLGGTINITLLGEGKWSYIGTSAEDGKNPTVIFSDLSDPSNSITKNTPWSEFISWQESK